MTPLRELGDQLPGNSPFGQKHLKDFVRENRLQVFPAQGRSYPEYAPPIGTSVRHQDMTVGIESEESPKIWMAMTAPGMGCLSGTAS